MVKIHVIVESQSRMPTHWALNIFIGMDNTEKVSHIFILETAVLFFHKTRDTGRKCKGTSRPKQGVRSEKITNQTNLRLFGRFLM